MFNFGLEITSVFCGKICPELVAQYHRNIHIAILFIPVASISYLSGEYYVPELQREAMKKASFDRVMKIPIMFGWQIIFSSF